MSGVKQLYLLLSKNKLSTLFLKKYKDPLSKNELLKLKKSRYKGDQDLYRLIISTVENTRIIDNKDDDEDNNEEEIQTQVIIKRVNEPVNVTGTLKRFIAPYQSFQADVADFNFTKPSGADPNYVLVCVDLFTQKIFTYGFRKKSFLPTVLQRFLDEIKKDRIFFTKHNPMNGGVVKDEVDVIRMQTDEEFTNNRAITSLCKDYRVHIFSTKINAGHASGAEQKIKILKEKTTEYLQSGSFNKKNKTKILRDVTTNINNLIVEKYNISPESLLEILRKDPEKIMEYDFYRMSKVTKAYDRRTKMYEKNISKKKSRLRKLKLNDLVLIPKGRIRKSDYPSALDKVTTNKKPYFERNIIFKISDITLNKNANNVTLYQVTPLTNIDVMRRRLQEENFVRDELYALKNNTVSLKKY